MTENQDLLAEFVKNGSEAAFRELVCRYTNLVYSVAVRLTRGDSQLAQDVGQTVFSDLARKARTLPPDVMLGGWLHRHTCYVAATVMRGERRRQARERHAVQMNAMQDHTEDNLARVAPILDEAINQLGAEDRIAVLLRFFEERDLRSVGDAIGTNENTARMRVTRALEKLHVLLKHRGVTLSTTALGTVLAGKAVTAAPVGLAVAFSSAALATAAAQTGTTLTILKIMTMTKLKVGIISAIVLAGVVTDLSMRHRSGARLLQENQSLLQQIAQLQLDYQSLSNRLALGKTLIAPHLPAPRMQVPTAPIGDLRSTNLYARLKDKSPKLTAEQAEAYLKANGRSAASLLAAFRTSGDPAMLEEAMQKYPNDPQVAFEAAFKEDVAPEEKRKWLDAFKHSAPDNALANYLSARDYLKSGQTDRAVQELIAASGKPQFQDYTQERIQDDEEAYLSADYSVAEAKAVSSMQLLLPQLAEVKQLALGIVELANSYRQAGDETSAQAALQMAANMGARYGNPSAGEAEVSQLVGIAVERRALSEMDPKSPYGNNGRTVQDQIDQLGQQGTALRDLGRQAEPLLEKMSDQDWISYKDRWRVFGEEAAFRWVLNKYGQK